MQIFNNNLKNIIQAKIDAASAATSLKDLMLLAKAAKGLNVNSANLDALISAKLNTLNGSSPLADLLVGAVASGLTPDTVAALVTQSAVKAGDPLWVDCAGTVYGGDRYRMTLNTLSPTASAANFEIFLALDSYRNLNNYDNSKIGFAVALSDGNVLLGLGNTESGNYGFNLSLTDGSFTRTVKNSLGQISFLSPSGDFNYYCRPVAVYKMAANVFRVYYRHPRNSAETELASISYYTVTYTPANQTVSISARTEVFTVGTNNTVSLVNEGRFVTDRFVIIRNQANNYNYVLDLQLGTTTEIVAARALIGSATSFMGTGSDIVAWFKPSASNGFIVKSDGSTVAAPSALNTDGALTGSGRIVMQLQKGVFLSIANGLIKLVAFNSAYTSATIQTLASDTLRITTGGTIRVLKNGRRFYIYRTSTSPFSLEVDETGNASGFRWEDSDLSYFPYVLTNHGDAVLDITETALFLVGHGVANTLGVFSGPLVEYLKKPASFVGTAMAPASAGSVCLVNLDPSVQPSPSVTYDLGAPYFGGYRRVIDKEERLLAVITSNTSSSSVLNREFNTQNASTTGSVGYGAIFLVPPGEGLLWGAQADSFSLSLKGPFGEFASSGNTNGAAIWYFSRLPQYGRNNRNNSTSYRIFD